ncbi:MAG: orotate phosphoribosyltransferase [Planctomycetota bacterium]|nr:orotate phosphoribosyltransferase [Planctomycetota bacterium]
MQPYQKAFVDFLLEAEALRIGEFTLKSGRVSPLFLNTGLLDTGGRYARLGEAFADTALERIGADGFDVVFGPAYKGIPLGIAMVLALAGKGVDKPALSDRKEAKTHGGEASDVPIAKRLLGRPPAADARFVMVDDVLTTGGTKVEALELLKECSPKGKTVALLVVLDRQETRPDGSNAVAAFAEETGVPVVPVVTLCETLGYLRESGRVDDADWARCLAYWREYGTPEAKAWVAEQD